MSRLISPGVYVLVLTLIAGIWIGISPFVLQTQASASAWSSSTINDVATGAVLMVVSLLGIGSQIVLALRDLVRSDAEPAS